MSPNLMRSICDDDDGDDDGDIQQLGRRAALQMCMMVQMNPDASTVAVAVASPLSVYRGILSGCQHIWRRARQSRCTCIYALGVRVNRMNNIRAMCHADSESICAILQRLAHRRSIPKDPVSVIDECMVDECA